MSEPPNGYRNANFCPYCNHKTDAAMIPEDESQVPESGALSVCIKCAKVSSFGDDMKLQRFDMNTLDIDDHAHVLRMQFMVHDVNGRYPKKKPKH